MSDRSVPLSRIVERLREADLVREVRGPVDLELTGVSQDSRSVNPGDLFLAWKGVDHDAHDFIAEAEVQGAVAAVVEEPVHGVKMTRIQVSDGRLAGALAADEVYGSPWRELHIAAVTGTNGKTTTTLLLRHLLAARGPTAAVTTLGLVEREGGVVPGTGGLTTPGPVQLSRWLRELADGGVESVVLEASSHALEQRRLHGIRVREAVFTNLSREHLDYHPDLEAYAAAKARLVDLLEPGGTLVVNAAEEAWDALSAPSGRTVRYGLDSSQVDVEATDVSLGARGSTFRLRTPEGESEVRLPLLGRFNVENSLAAAAGAVARGVEIGEIAGRLEEVPQIPGRLERVVGSPFTVLIDFAHTPEALERVLDTLRPLTEGRLLVVFGAGGDRDRTKRSEMGRVAADRADLSVVTSDNPRTEDPGKIVDEVLEGMEEGSYERIVDRREAIARALELARVGDTVVLSGKGHERYQVVGRERRPFDEREIVRELLARRRGAYP